LAPAESGFWDKLGTVSGFLSAILVASIGFYATQIYDQRTRDLELAEKQRTAVAAELQAIEKFFPHLNVAEGPEKAAAIEIVSSISRSEIGGRIANAYRGPSARAALISMGNNATSKEKEKIDAVISDLYRSYSEFVYYVQTDQTNVCGAFVASDDGRLLTASHCIPARSKTREVCVSSLNVKNVAATIGRRDRSRKLSASLITWDDGIDIALLKLDIGENIPYGIIKDDAGPDFAPYVVAVGTDASDQQMRMISAKLADYSSDRLSLTAEMPLSFAGSPLLNSDGIVVGMLTATAGQKAVGVPPRIIRRLMEACGS